MPYILCIDPKDTEIEVPFEPGDTLLQAVKKAGVEGLIAECGGGCACATCHVILNREWSESSLPNPYESDMLNYVIDLQPHSRLACQIILTETHHQLTATIAKRQF